MTNASMNRRRLVGWFGGAALLPLLPTLVTTGLIAPLPARADQAAFKARRMLMGTWVDVTVADGSLPGVEAAVSAAFDEMARLATMMSRYDPGSRLAALNAAAGSASVAVPPEMLRVLRTAQDLSRRTAGRFDVTVGRLTPGPGGLDDGNIPDDATVERTLRHVRATHLKVDPHSGTARIDDPLTRVDLGGVAKLPILEAGLALLTARGIHGAMINGGGDVLASARADDQPWRIGVRDPAAPDTLLAVLPLRAGVVASSGDYERYVMHDGHRYHHVIDPATGRPSRGVHGVTLVADRVADVNGLGTAAMVAGPSEGPALLARCGVRQALLVGTDGATWISRALAPRLLPPPGRDRVRGLG